MRILSRVALLPNLIVASCTKLHLHGLLRYYKTVDEPLLTGAQLAALAAAEAASRGDGAQQAQQAQQADQAELPPRERVAPVPPELKAQLAHYRWAACLCYDNNTGEQMR